MKDRWKYVFHYFILVRSVFRMLFLDWIDINDKNNKTKQEKKRKKNRKENPKRYLPRSVCGLGPILLAIAWIVSSQMCSKLNKRKRLDNSLREYRGKITVIILNILCNSHVGSAQQTLWLSLCLTLCLTTMYAEEKLLAWIYRVIEFLNFVVKCVSLHFVAANSEQNKIKWHKMPLTISADYKYCSLLAWMWSVSNPTDYSCLKKFRLFVACLCSR